MRRMLLASRIQANKKSSGKVSFKIAKTSNIRLINIMSMFKPMLQSS